MRRFRSPSFGNRPATLPTPTPALGGFSPAAEMSEVAEAQVIMESVMYVRGGRREAFAREDNNAARSVKR